jgi:hypothetical protein
MPGAPLDDDLVGLHARDLATFCAHSGWDASRKIQAVLDASGIAAAPTLEVCESRDHGTPGGHGDSSDRPAQPPEEQNGGSYEDEDDEQAWLQHFADLCQARTTEVEAERARKAAASASNVAAAPSKASASFLRRGSVEASQAATSSAGQSKPVPTGSGAQFFQKMLSADK